MINCIFSHEDKNKTVKRKALVQSDPEPKRNKPQETPNEVKDKKEPAQDILFVLPKALTTGVVIPRIVRIECARGILKHIQAKSNSKTPKRDTTAKEFEIASSCKTELEYKEKVNDYLGIRSKAPKVDPRHIMPIEVNPSPAMLPVRKKYIELFVEALRRTDPSLKTPVWTAIEEECKIASTNSTTTYNLAIKRKLYGINHPERVKQAAKPTHTKADYVRELRELSIPVEKLEKYGYIMQTPAIIAAPEPVRVCHRCKLEFKLENVMTTVDCRYHSGRMVRNALNVRIYLCCGGVVGETDTEPCTKLAHHVFYWLSPEEMHHFLPFINTREAWGARKGSLEAIGIDCEMGFTSKGFELLRITAIDFFSGEEVLDLLVRPKGEVLDLNTRWSGVAEIKEEALTFEDLIALLGEIADANTIMIGHGLENDMNAMRLIHDKVVDTAILYPRHKTSPTFRFALKQLAFKYLGRNIQTGQHDSGEDSLAAIDITKHFIKQDLDHKLSLGAS